MTDWEAFRQALPKAAPEELIDLAARTQKDELGGELCLFSRESVRLVGRRAAADHDAGGYRATRKVAQADVGRTVQLHGPAARTSPRDGCAG